MGEIFQRQFSRSNLEWTGERLTSEITGQIEVEHFHRYFLARHLCRDLDVLDIAAGEGYGTAFLAQVARSAIGVELSPDAVRHARHNYARPNLTYISGDARKIPLRDKCVDIVVSFETIEHFYEQDSFLSEIQRVLRPGGKLIISSPNRDVYSQPETAANPYHALELSPQEFSSLIGKYFSHLHILEQRTVMGSALIGQASSQWLTFEKRGDKHFEMSHGLPRCPYVVAVASNAPIEVPASSIYIETSEIGLIFSQSQAYPSLAEAYKKARDQIESERRHAANLEGEIARLSSDVDNTRQHAANLESEVTRLSGELDNSRQHAANLEAERGRLRQHAVSLEAEVARLSGDLDNSRQHAVNLEIERRQLITALEAQRHAFSTANHLRGRVEQKVRRIQRGLEAYRALLLRAVDASDKEAPDRGSNAEQANAITESGLFDAESYAGRDEALALGMSPAEHYLQVGEAAGLAPSALFDPAYYAECNPDVTASGSPLLLHYVRYGRAENRASRSMSAPLPEDQQDLASAVAAIAESGLFDAESYAGRDEALALGMSPAEHYLQVGEAAGLAPSALFDPAYYAECNPDVTASGSPLLLHYVRYGRAENRASRSVSAPLPEDQEGLASAVAAIAESGLFDAENYAGRDQALALGMSPAEHYLQVGEAAGLMPSRNFDPVYYAARYPDIGQLPVGRLLHYVQFGRAEGRRGLPFASTLGFERLNLDPKRDSIAVIVHDGSRTGAPILAWNIVEALAAHYNVVVFLKRGGSMEKHFSGSHIHLVCCFDKQHHSLDEIESDAVVDTACRSIDFTYAIANSVESRQFIPGFERHGVPVVALVHEFSAYTKPSGILWKAYSMASELVFSSQITVDSSLKDYAPLNKRSYHIIPQGPSQLPFEPTGAAAQNDPADLPISEGAFLVIGMGAVQIRKGVDLFIATAAELRRRAPEAKICFLWVGGGYEPDQDLNYSVYLREQLQRSEFDETIFVGEVADLKPYLSRAQLFFLSSRLDPLPNVAIDAMLSGVPVISFEGASGIADLLRVDATTSELVVPHLSICSAAERIIELYDDLDRLASLGKSSARFAHATFNMLDYVTNLDALGLGAASRMKRILAPAQMIAKSGIINSDLMLDQIDRALPLDMAVRQYLVTSKSFAPWSRPGTGDWLRRPVAGFHPLIYAAECARFDERGDEDPLAHFLRTGCPEGRWLHHVLQPTTNTPPATMLKAALHAHFHYPELLEDLLKKLQVNQSACDLYLTTTDRKKEDELHAILTEHQVEARVDVVPNRGRDFGPFLTDLLPNLIGRYDIIGHVHGKRSLRLGTEFGERWREFLWQHLVGAKHPMMDHVFRLFEEDTRIGLVFPLDPHLIDWTENRVLANALAGRLGLEEALPTHFEFPIGTMFWARTDALRPLLKLECQWSDYPSEPAEDDGTILHALERLLPFVAQSAQYKFATTHVPGSTR